MAIMTFCSILKNWNIEQEDRVVMRTIGFVIVARLVLIIAVVAGFELYAAFGWLATIPSWAAVIIVLLVLILLK